VVAPRRRCHCRCRLMSFDTLAPYYRLMERVLAGNLLQCSRTAFLAETAECRNALLLGEGPGRFLAELLRVNPRVQVTCVERSPGMIRAARAALDAAAVTRVRFVQVDALAWQPPLRHFDLVVSHFFLDCFRREELAGLVAKVSQGATASARWLLADFREPDRGWRRWRGRVVLAVMYAFFRLTTRLAASAVTPPEGYLTAAGFRLMQRRLSNHGLIHSDCWRRDAA